MMAAFHDAASYLSSAPSLSKVSNTVKLELYGLFKYLTVSPTPNTSRPSLFDITGKAKWDAWNAAGNTYEDHNKDAENRYLEIAKSLGWEEGTTGPPTTSQEEGGLPDDWETRSNDSGSNKEGGMAVSVSAMTAPLPSEEDKENLHGLAIANDTDGLLSFLEKHQDADIDELDEFGYTPLHLACDRGNASAADVLLKKGADPSKKDPDDFTALDLARVAGHDTVVSLIQERL